MGVGIAVVDLDFVADFGGGSFEVGRGSGAIVAAGGVADGDAAVALGLGPELDVEVEFAEVVAFGVEPGLGVFPGAVFLFGGTSVPTLLE
jgi:hypothetical protein